MIILHIFESQRPHIESPKNSTHQQSQTEDSLHPLENEDEERTQENSYTKPSCYCESSCVDGVHVLELIILNLHQDAPDVLGRAQHVEISG